MSRRLIVRHESTLLRRGVSWWVALALLAVCVAYAWSNGSTFRERGAAEVASEIAAAEEHLESEREAVAAGEPGGFSGRAGSARTVAVKPTGRLADFAIGQSELYPYRADISAFRRGDNLFRNYQLQSPLTLLSGRFDLSFVVVYLLPLLVIALSYDLLSAEKERGTLPIAMTQPISIRQLFDAKLVARLALVLVPFVLLATAAFLASADLSAERSLLFTLWTLTATAYGLFWLAVAAFVNSSGRSSQTNAVILACLWLALVVIVPGVLNILVGTMKPTPSRLLYVTEMRSATAEASKRSGEVLAKYYEDHPELAAADMRGGFLPAYFAQQREIEARVRPIVDDFEWRLDAQQRLVRATSVLSPAVLVQESFNEIAGTGLARQRSFSTQTREFLAQWHEALRPKIFTAAEMTPADYGRLPGFDFREESLGEISRRAVTSVLKLLIPAAALLLWARRRVGATSVIA